MKKNILFFLVAPIVMIFLILFGMTTYHYYQAIHSDDPIDPYLAVEMGSATIVRGDIAIDMEVSDTYILRESDIIITRAASQAVLHWPDHSTTRLGADSRLTIDRMRVAQDYSSIELVASLENGKVWSNMVRTIYPGSRIEFHMPKMGTVAGVRGTVFDINLVDNYIRSVDHSITLRSTFGKTVTLLSGEAVRANDIYTKIITGFDTTWASINAAKDNAYDALRDAKLRETYMLLVGKSDIPDLWDEFVRWILSWFSTFRDLDVMRSIDLGSLEQYTKIPQELIMKWYQSFQSSEFALERDKIRTMIFSLQDSFIN